ncbi:hypothetical protein C3L57_07050 [Veillonellaceae bacterium M2-8]|nr:hypothetical protein [Veillonellaceae bacterium M2-8]
METKNSPIRIATLTRKQLAERWHCDVHTIIRFENEGNIRRCPNVAGQVQYPIEEIERGETPERKGVTIADVGRLERRVKQLEQVLEKKENIINELKENLTLLVKAL